MTSASAQGIAQHRAMSAHLEAAWITFNMALDFKAFMLGSSISATYSPNSGVLGNVGQGYSLGSVTNIPCTFTSTAAGIGPWTQPQLEAQMRSLVPVAASTLTNLVSANSTARVQLVALMAPDTLAAGIQKWAGVQVDNWSARLRAVPGYDPTATYCPGSVYNGMASALRRVKRPEDEWFGTHGWSARGSGCHANLTVMMASYSTVGQALPPVTEVLERMLYDLIMFDSRITDTMPYNIILNPELVSDFGPSPPPAPRPPPRPPPPQPTASPTAVPSPEPTGAPTALPTAAPSPKPTAAPTASPMRTPSPKPTSAPTLMPTSKPTPKPTSRPTPKPAAKSCPVAQFVKGTACVKCTDKAAPTLRAQPAGGACRLSETLTPTATSCSVLKLTAKASQNRKAQSCMSLGAVKQQVWLPLAQIAGRLKINSVNLAAVRIGGLRVQKSGRQPVTSFIATGVGAGLYVTIGDSKKTLKSGVKVVLEGSLADLRGSGQQVCFQAALAVCGPSARGLRRRRRLAAAGADASGAGGAGLSRSLLAAAPAPPPPSARSQYRPAATSADQQRLAELVRMRANLRVTSSACSSVMENHAKDLLDLSGKACDVVAITLGKYFAAVDFAKDAAANGVDVCNAAGLGLGILGQVLGVCDLVGACPGSVGLSNTIVSRAIDIACKLGTKEALGPLGWLSLACDAAQGFSSLYDAAAQACSGGGACAFSECALGATRCLPANFPPDFDFA